MKKFLLATTSESGDSYYYFIENNKKPTSKEIKEFLLKYGTDIDEEEQVSYENVDTLIEITGFQKLK